MKFAAREPGLGEHLLVFRESIRVAVGRGGEHRQREARRGWRRDAVGLRDEIQRQGSAARRQGREGFRRQLFASGHIKVMQKIRQQHDIVWAAPIDLESAARTQGMTPGYAGALGVLRRHGQHIRPIQPP